MKSIIIDDEQASHDDLLHVLDHQNETKVQVLDSAYSVAEGFASIQQHQPELIFLDIEMSDGTGFDLLKKIGRPDFQIIFVTAFNQYAQTAIRFGALDYLTKPVSPEELSASLIRAQLKKMERVQLKQLEIMQETLQILKRKESPRRISISTAEGVLFFPTSDIVRLEAMQNYTQFNFKSGQKVLASLNLKKFELDLKPFNDFMRIHKSHIVRIWEIVRFIKGEKSYVELSDGVVLPVSKNRRGELLERLG